LTVALATGTALHAPTAGAASREAKLLEAVNRVRQAHGLAALRLNLDLSEDAERHTHRMIELDAIFDPPNLTRLLRPFDWRRVAGSVAGCALTVRGLVRTWMHHAEHREVLMLGGVRWAGFGVVAADEPNACGHGSLWSTGILYG
jgi:uncharacterized protein YkwD